MQLRDLITVTQQTVAVIHGCITATDLLRWQGFQLCQQILFSPQRQSVLPRFSPPCLFLSHLAVSSFPALAASLILLSLPRLSKGHHIDYAPRNGRLVQRTIMLADARKGKAMQRKSFRFLPASLMPVAAEVGKYNWHRRNRFVTESRSEEETITQRIQGRSKLAANEISIAYRTLILGGRRKLSEFLITT